MGAFENNSKPHIGHRKRIKDNYLKKGLWVLDDTDVLELLLTFAIPRKDVYEKARGLTELFGSADSVLSADPLELRVKGKLSEHTVTLLKLVNDIRSKPYRDRDYRGERLTSVLSAARFCHKLMRNETEESVIEIFIDKDDCVTDIAKVSGGSAYSAELPVAGMIEAACRRGVTRIIVAHNHPSGSSSPSSADIAATEELVKALRAQRMELVEHVIAARDECTLILHHQTIALSQDPESSAWKSGSSPSSNPTGQ